jgi:heme/copper-type cytochrome/quinol oxidase subunit 2
MNVRVPWRFVVVALVSIVASVLTFGVSVAQAGGMPPFEYPGPEPLSGTADTVAVIVLIAAVVVGFIVYAYLSLRRERGAQAAPQIRSAPATKELGEKRKAA